MPLQNRVQPTGEIAAIAMRGLFTGNRGILRFDGQGRLGTARWAHPHWIICTLSHPRGRYHGPQPARGWTPLFFLDEAVGLAAGHRPCAYCRRAAYGHWKDAWQAARGARADHKTMDAALHRARVTRTRAQIRHQAQAETLPDGAFVLIGGTAHLLWGDAALPFEGDRYGAPLPRPDGQITVLSPAPTLGALAAGYRPALHPSAASAD